MDLIQFSAAKTLLNTYFSCKDDNKQMLSVQKNDEVTTEKYFKAPTYPLFLSIMLITYCKMLKY